MMAAQQGVVTTGQKMTYSTRAMAIAQTEAIERNKNFDKGLGAIVVTGAKTETFLQRLRPSLAAVATQAVGTSAAMGTVASTLGAFALGNAVTIGILLGLAAIAKGYDLLTAKSRELKKANEEAMASLRKEREEHELGIGGALVRDLRVAEKALVDLKKRAAEIEAASKGKGQSSAGGVVDMLRGRDINQEIADNEKDQRRVQERINALRADAEQAAADTKTRERNALLSGDNAIAADRKAALEKLAYDIKLLKRLNAEAAMGADNLALRSKLAGDIKAAQDALNPKKATKDATDDAYKTAERFNKQSIEWDQEAAKNRATLNAHYRDTSAAIKESAETAAVLKATQDINAIKPPAVVERSLFKEIAEDGARIMHEEWVAAFATLPLQLHNVLRSTFTDGLSGLRGSLGDVFVNLGATIGTHAAESMLKPLGKMFMRMGSSLGIFGKLMNALKAAFTWNPILSGAISIAAGVALVSLGKSLGGAVSGHTGGTLGGGIGSLGIGGSPTTPQVYTFGQRHQSTPTGAVSAQPGDRFHFTVIGANDPTAQRQIMGLIDNAQRRGIGNSDRGRTV
jgi:hypothetical protein